MTKTPGIYSHLRRGEPDQNGLTDVDALALNEANVADGVENLFAADPLPDLAPINPARASNLVAAPWAGGTAGPKLPQTDVFAKTAAAIAPVSVNPVPVVTVANGASVEIEGVSGQSVTFAGATGTLKLDDSLAFTGQISGLTGSDAIDLADVSYAATAQATYLGNANGGTLTITDGVHTANITLQGNYLASSWDLTSDGNGGTMVVDPVAANNWQELKIGAGGFLSGLDVAPDGTMVVRTDTYGAYIWNGTQWQQLVTSTSMPSVFVAPGNNQGVYEIQIASSNSNIMYMMYEGDVFKSTNKGTTWTLTNFANVTVDPNDAIRGNGQKMAIDPNNPNVVYVGTQTNGLFVTTDGGVTWQQVSAVPVGKVDPNGNYPGITGIMFDPALGVTGGKTNTIFASSYDNGVYESTDGGASWTHLSGGPPNVEYAAVSSTGAYYAVGNDAQYGIGLSLYRYMNGQWTTLLTDSTNGISQVAVNPLNPSEIVVQNDTGNINVSYNGGATWTGYNATNQVVSADIPWLASTGSALYGSSIAFNPSVPNELISGAGIGVWTTVLPQNFTANTPVTWNSQSAGIEQLVANQIIVPPGGKPVVASWDRAFFYVANPNQYPTSFGPVGGAFAAGWSLDYASSSPNFVVGIAESNITNGEESGYSTDGGQTWSKFASVPADVASGAIGGTIAASSPTDIVWAPAGGVQPYYTLNGGVSWQPVTLPGVSSWSGFDYADYLNQKTVTADRVLSNTFYIYVATVGVFKSANGGTSWTKVFSGDLSPNDNVESEIESVPGEAGNLFFTGGPQGGTLTEPFMRSTDGGATWTAVPNVLEVSCFGFGAPAPGQSYPSIFIVGYVNKVYGIWESDNNAQSWTQIGTYPNSSLDQITTISGDPNTYGQVYVGFRGSGFAYLPAASATTTSVSSVTESPSTGDFNAGKTVTLTLNLNSPVTVAGGTPTLTLNDGGVATYGGGSGTTALTFSYTVGTSDINVASLAATAVNLNGATIKDGSGNAASLSLSGITQAGPQIDISTVIRAISETPSSGYLSAGKTVTYTLAMNEVVTVDTTGGSPSLVLNDGGTATYVGGSGTNALTFSYTVLAGQNTPDLMVSSVNLNGANVTDGAGNSANFSLSGLSQGSPVIDTTPPTLSSVSATSGSYNSGKTLTLTLNMSEAVTVTGTPTLTLNDGGTATYAGGSGSSALTFSYTVGSGQNTAGLAVTAVNGTITDLAGNALSTSKLPETFTGVVIDTTTPSVSSVAASGTGIASGSGDLGVGSVVTLTLNMSEAVTVAGGTPTLTLNDGGTASYTGGTGTNALTFSYTVATGQNTSDLAVTAVNLNSATVKNGAGTAANLTGAVTNPAGTLQIDTTTPSVSSVVASGTGISNGSGDLATGSVVTLTVNMSEAVTVAGGTPTLTLNDGGTATYTGGSGSSALTFSYMVAAGQNTSDLAVSALSLNGATVTNGGGTAANLTGAVTNPAGTLQIDTTTPSVSSVVASGSGITAGTGDVGAGSVVTLTVNLSEAVTVAGGTPTLTLNDGGTATYTGGSDSSALTFSYTVAAGQNTSDLAVTAVNLNSATVKNGAGTSANLAGAVTNPSGMLQIDSTTPTVSQVTASPGTGTELPGTTITFTVGFSEAVSVTGTPTLTLNDGGTATYTGGSGTSALTFSYTAGSTDSAVSALAITQANLPNGATIKDGAGNAANLSGAVTTFTGLATDPPVYVRSVADSPANGDLNVGKTVTLTLSLSGAVTLSGGTPTLALNDGGTATYTGGSGSNALTFSYTVASSDTNVASLAATAVNLNGATVLDGGGNAASLSLSGLAQTGPQIDTTTPAISTIAETPSSGDLNAGKTVTYTLTMSEAVTVNTTGGSPTLALNDGGTATYVSGSGTNALTFSYTVQPGQNTPDLMVSAFNLNGASITDGAGNAANVSLAGIAQGSPAVDTTPPTVASVTAAAGDYDAGKALTLTLNMSEAVSVTGTPTLTLNDGGTATYVSGSGSSTLTFSYAVGAGQNTSALAVTGVTGTITDLAGNALSTSGLPQTFTGVIVDTAAPTVSSVASSGTGITAGSGDLGTGSVVTLTVNLTEAVKVAGGTPTLTLNNGGTATYAGGSGTNALTFNYTAAAGQSTPDLTVIAVNLNGATVKDVAGNAANLTGAVTNPAGTLQIDTTLPSVSSVVATGTGIAAGTGDLAAGSVVTLTLNLSKAVTVAGGTPTLSLNDGGTASFTGGSGTNALTFSYTVGAGQNTSDLAVAGLSLNGATVQDAVGNAANLSGAVTNPGGTLQIDTTTPTVSSVAASGTGITAGSGDLGTGRVVTLTVNLSEAVTVAGGTPTLTLNDGGTATYTGGSGSNALTFSYAVAAGQNTPDLVVTAVNLNGATVKNGAGTAANLAGAVTNPSGTLQIDTTTAAVSSVAAAGTGIMAGAGDLAAGSLVTLTVNLSEAVTVAGGTPTLTLNDGGTATYTGGSGSNALTFSYTVAAGQNTPDLTVAAINLNGATVKNGAGTAANLSGAVSNPSGTLQIDTIAPTVSSVVASGTGIKNGAATLGAGAVVTLTVNLSEAVTVAGGTPTLSLNDGGTATYAGGSGSNALTFSYMVAAGQSTNDLTVTGFNLNGASVKDGAGNAANLAGAVTNPQGKLKIYTGTQKVLSTSTTTSGTTSLVAIGNEYALNTSGSTAVIGPELSYNGTPVIAGQFGSWTPIATVQTASGYDVAWQIAGTNQYTIWSTDSSGNYVSNLAPLLAGNSTAFEAFETTFGQDLNGDGTTGVKSTLIQTDGTTSLVEYGNNYALDAVGSSTTGPLLKYNGSMVTAGAFGSWTPIGAVQTASGYDIAWQVSGTNQYTIWSTDSTGNYLSNLAPVLAGNSTALEAFETTFQQDLNGDGTVGVPTTLIQTDGTTKLVEYGTNYALDTVGSSTTGPLLKYNGSVVTAGEFGSWTPIGAVQTATGYDVAWQVSGTNNYTIWSTDSSGNYLSKLAPVLAGNSTALESFETTFQQDLNGDGVTGVKAVPIQTDGTTSLVEYGNNFALDTVGSSTTGPLLKYNGSVVTVGEIGNWTPIGAVQTATGYDIAWQVSGTNQYTIWSTDSSGNYLSNLAPVLAGNSTALETFETTFQQDINGDGTVGVKSTLIQTDGTTGLVEYGNNYALDAVGSSTTGPLLKYNGSVVTAGAFGGWTPIGAVQTATGYDIAWQVSGTNQYTIWSTDSSGNYVSNLAPVVAGNSSTLQSFETTFQQDLNGDGVITIPAGQSMELTGSYSGEIVFGGTTGSLKIDHAADFTGTIGGPLAPTDQIDFADINFNSATLGYSGNNSPGSLTVSDGTNTATLSVLGNHSLANFIASSDGHGGTIVVDPPLAGQGGSLDQQVALFSQYMASAFPAGGTAPSTLADSSETGIGMAQYMASPSPSQQHASMLS